LSNNYPNLKLFSEPDENNNMQNFIEYASNSNQYILKFHLKQFSKFPPNVIKKIFSNDAFLIRIRRRNIIAQMVSMYIELCRGVWEYFPDTLEKHKDEKIIIDHDTINIAIQTVKNYNNYIDTVKINYDLNLYYEDLVEEFADISPTIITPKPINHDEIYRAIKSQLR
jgi:LPS sulfotransferase NodH